MKQKQIERWERIRDSAVLSDIADKTGEYFNALGGAGMNKQQAFNLTDKMHSALISCVFYSDDSGDEDWVEV